MSTNRSNFDVRETGEAVEAASNGTVEQKRAALDYFLDAAKPNSGAPTEVRITAGETLPVLLRDFPEMTGEIFDAGCDLSEDITSTGIRISGYQCIQSVASYKRELCGQATDVLLQLYKDTLEYKTIELELQNLTGCLLTVILAEPQSALQTFFALVQEATREEKDLFWKFMAERAAPDLTRVCWAKGKYDDLQRSFMQEVWKAFESSHPACKLFCLDILSLLPLCTGTRADHTEANSFLKLVCDEALQEASEPRRYAEYFRLMDRAYRHREKEADPRWRLVLFCGNSTEGAKWAHELRVAGEAPKTMAWLVASFARWKAEMGQKVDPPDERLKAAGLSKEFPVKTMLLAIEKIPITLTVSKLRPAIDDLENYLMCSYYMWKLSKGKIPNLLTPNVTEALRQLLPAAEEGSSMRYADDVEGKVEQAKWKNVAQMCRNMAVNPSYERIDPSWEVRRKLSSFSDGIATPTESQSPSMIFSPVLSKPASPAQPIAQVKLEPEPTPTPDPPPPAREVSVESKPFSIHGSAARGSTPIPVHMLKEVTPPQKISTAYSSPPKTGIFSIIGAENKAKPIPTLTTSPRSLPEKPTYPLGTGGRDYYDPPSLSIASSYSGTSSFSINGAAGKRKREESAFTARDDAMGMDVDGALDCKPSSNRDRERGGDGDLKKKARLSERIESLNHSQGRSVPSSGAGSVLSSSDSGKRRLKDRISSDDTVEDHLTGADRMDVDRSLSPTKEYIKARLDSELPPAPSRQRKGHQQPPNGRLPEKEGPRVEPMAGPSTLRTATATTTSPGHVPYHPAQTQARHSPPRAPASFARPGQASTSTYPRRGGRGGGGGHYTSSSTRPGGGGVVQNPEGDYSYPNSNFRGPPSNFNPAYLRGGGRGGGGGGVSGGGGRQLVGVSSPPRSYRNDGPEHFSRGVRGTSYRGRGGVGMGMGGIAMSRGGGGSGSGSGSGGGSSSGGDSARMRPGIDRPPHMKTMQGAPAVPNGESFTTKGRGFAYASSNGYGR